MSHAVGIGAASGAAQRLGAGLTEMSVSAILSVSNLSREMQAAIARHTATIGGGLGAGSVVYAIAGPIAGPGAAAVVVGGGIASAGAQALAEHFEVAPETIRRGALVFHCVATGLSLVAFSVVAGPAVAVGAVGLGAVACLATSVATDSALQRVRTRLNPRHYSPLDNGHTLELSTFEGTQPDDPHTMADSAV